MGNLFRTKRGIGVFVRWLNFERDISAILRIEQFCDRPWTEDNFLCNLFCDNCYGMTAEMNGKVIGFMIYIVYKSRLHILKFAVHPKYRRQRVGSFMIAKLIDKLLAHRRNYITLRVRETNLEAQLFFREHGFRAIKVLRSHYEDSGEDAFLMQYRLFEEADDYTVFRYEN